MSQFGQLVPELTVEQDVALPSPDMSGASPGEPLSGKAPSTGRALRRHKRLLINGPATRLDA